MSNFSVVPNALEAPVAAGAAPGPVPESPSKTLFQQWLEQYNRVEYEVVDMYYNMFKAGEIPQELTATMLMDMQMSAESRGEPIIARDHQMDDAQLAAKLSMQRVPSACMNDAQFAAQLAAQDHQGPNSPDAEADRNLAMFLQQEALEQQKQQGSAQSALDADLARMAQQQEMMMMGMVNGMNVNGMGGMGGMGGYGGMGSGRGFQPRKPQKEGIGDWIAEFPHIDGGTISMFHKRYEKGEITCELAKKLLGEKEKLIVARQKKAHPINALIAAKGKGRAKSPMKR